MLMFASHLIVAFTAALLVLPVGWCCATTAPAATEATTATPAASNCCSQHAPSHRPDEPTPASQHPVAQKCCCHYEATPPSVQKLLPDLTVALGPVVLPDPQPAGANFHLDPLATGPPVAPPHRVLHCVWRL